MKLKKLFAISIIGATLSLSLINGSFAEESKKDNMKMTEKVIANKAIVAVVKADWCPSCEKIGPVVMQIMKEYDKTTQFVILDVTNSKTSKKADKLSKKLGISDFFKANKSKTATVAIIDANSKEVLKTFQGESDKKAYEFALDAILKK